MSILGYVPRRGRFRPVEGIVKFGYNADIDSGTAEDVWVGGATYVPPTAARIHNVVSGEAADAAAGTGARTVQISGLDATYNEIDETVTLNGTTNVPTTKSYLRMHRARVLTAGSGGSNAGIITATAVTDATVSAHVAVGENQTQQAFYTVPSGKLAAVVSFHGSASGGSTAAPHIKLFVRPRNEVFQLKQSLHIEATGASYAQHDFAVPLTVEAKSDIKIVAVSSAANTKIAAGFDLVFI